MTIKNTFGLALIALIAAPGLALAQGCRSDEAKITASSCEAGTVWNEALETCLPMTNS